MPQKQTRRKPRRKGLQHPCPVGKDARGVTGAAEPAVPDAPGTGPEPPPSRARAHLERWAPPAALRSAAPQGSRWNRAELGLLWCDFYPDGWDEASRGMPVMQSRAQASRFAARTCCRRLSTDGAHSLCTSLLRAGFAWGLPSFWKLELFSV